MPTSGMNHDKIPLLEVKHLKKYFPVGHGSVLKAVDDVSFELYEGETLGIVGESGCGKTTCGRTSVGLYSKTDGECLYHGRDIHKMNRKERKAFAREVQTVFQDPYSSLDPRKTVMDIIAEGIDIHKLAANATEREEQVCELLSLVGLSKEHAGRYIHEFSGGQRQRIGIARALAVNPKLIFCDEPVSALDVSVQAQIINLLLKLQQERNLSYLFVAHDLSVVKHFSDRIAVMYLGQIVEIAESDELYRNPLHPYTKVLLSAIPIPDPDLEHSREHSLLTGDVPSPIDPPAGCRFRSRCPFATDCCRQVTPELKNVAAGHWVACHMI